jgi:drug/metabolite transporter (DMT)-like permease
MALDSRSQGSLAVAAGGLLLGTLGVFIEEAGQHPLTAVFFRCLFGALALALFAGLCGRGAELRPSARGLALAALTGCLMTAMWAAFFAAIQWTSIAVATVVFHLQPVWLMLAGAIWLGERLSAQRALAIVGALFGLTLATGLVQADWPADRPRFAFGIGMALLGSICYAAVALVARQQRAMGSLALTFWQCVTGCALLAWWPVQAELAAQWSAWTPATWAWLIGLGAIHTGLAYVLIYGGMQHLEAGRIAVLQFVYPAAAIVLDAWVYGRWLSNTQWLGVGLMGLALWGAGRVQVQTAAMRCDSNNPAASRKLPRSTTSFTSSLPPRRRRHSA